MRPTRIGLADKTRQTSIALLQKALNDGLDLRLATKQAHWTVNGPHFQQLHELFDSFVKPLDDEIDGIAERIATLGGTPDGRSVTVGEHSQLQPYPLEVSGGPAHLSALADRFAAFGNTVRESIDAADEAGDADTADIFTALSRFLDQSVWFLEANMQPE